MTTPSKTPGEDGAKSHEIALYDEIGESLYGGMSAAMFKDQFNALGARKGDSVLVRINSPGGDVFDGVGIYNTLKLSPAKIVTRNEGIALSCAGFIMMAGDECQMAENSIFMMHDAWSLAIGNAAQLRTQADMLEKTCNSVLVPAYAAKSGKRPDTIRNMLAKDDGFGTWLNAKECMDAGFCDSVLETTKMNKAQARAKFDPKAFPQFDEKAPAWVKAWAQSAEPVHWRRLAAKRRLELDATL